jgi:lipid-binding SYLF domain-containing protein
MKKYFTIVFSACFVFLFLCSAAFAATAKQIDNNVDVSLKLFKDVKGADFIIQKAQGVLVFPKVIKAGIGIGGEYGEGVLRIKGNTVDYYSTASASVGFQLGAQKKTIIIVFLDKNTLDDFRDSSGWKVGVDASVAVIAVGAGGSIDSSSINEPIIGFILDQKGLMYNLTLEGAKITKLKK